MSPAGNRPRRAGEARHHDDFVDAAFAFAATLLLVSGSEPIASVAGLKASLLQVPASAAALASVALFWSAHRGYSR